MEVVVKPEELPVVKLEVAGELLRVPKNPAEVEARPGALNLCAQAHF